MKTYTDPDIGKCDDCGSEAGRRTRRFRDVTMPTPNGGRETAKVAVWLCDECRRQPYRVGR